MGDTYEKVMESEETYALQTQRSIMNDYTEMIDDASNDKDYRPFMICVSQKNESGDSGSSSWQGNMAVIKKSVENGISSVQKKIDKKLNQV